MKNKLLLVPILALALLALSCASVVTAFSPILSLGKEDGSVWIIEPIPGSGLTKNVDVHSLRAFYGFNIPNPDGTYPTYEIPIKDVNTFDSYVKISFAKSDLPQQDVDFSYVTGALENGEEFAAYGPGFTWGRR